MRERREARLAAREAQLIAEEAARLADQQRLAFEPKMVSIRDGSYRIGSPSSEVGRDDDEKQHDVQIGSFKLSKYETTFAEYDAFVKATGRELPDDEGWGRGSRPVVNVNWRDAVAYASWLSKKTGKHYRLPTEAEWEYATRAGTRNEYSWGSAIGKNRANCDGCGSKWDNKQTALVGQFAGNGWGLHDMHENVWEWTCSAYNKTYDGSEGQCASQNSDVDRILRGGSWYNFPLYVRAANRLWFKPGGLNFGLGFRLAQDK